jgi:predicted signal transduction protein with EAL and GGDEF domain
LNKDKRTTWSRHHTLDDFGSGFSALNYVMDLSVDGLKIDKSFVDGLGEDPVNDAIVRLIVDFEHTLGLEVTAEGVENGQQVNSLTVMRCDLAQAFYFSKPLPSEAAGRSWRRALCGGCLDKDRAVAAGIDLLPLRGGDPYTLACNIHRGWQNNLARSSIVLGP